VISAQETNHTSDSSGGSKPVTPISQNQRALLVRVRIARKQYEQAVAEFAAAVGRYSELPLSDREKADLLRGATERERAAFTAYKELLDSIGDGGESAPGLSAQQKDVA